MVFMISNCNLLSTDIARIQLRSENRSKTYHQTQVYLEKISKNIVPNRYPIDDTVQISYD